MRSANRSLKTFFTYPFTWLAVALIAGLHIAFTLILQPSWLFQLAAFGVDIAAAALWFVFAFKSKDFKERLNRMPYESRGREVTELVRGCPEPFQRPALASIGLINKINSEFSGNSYRLELEMMLSNIRDLARNHKTLSARAADFGDAAQKKTMDEIMSNQLAAINNTLATLKTFSGNLTLLEANAGQSQAAADELKDLNEALKEVIKEM